MHIVASQGTPEEPEKRSNVELQFRNRKWLMVNVESIAGFGRQGRTEENVMRIRLLYWRSALGSSNTGPMGESDTVPD